MRNLGFLILMLVATAAAGQDPRFSFTAVPNPPASNQPFEIRVTVAALYCYVLPNALTISQPAANVVQYELRMVDSCLPLPEQQRTYTVPALPAGQYTLRLAACAAPPAQLPTAPCGMVAERSIVVAPMIEPRAIPALSPLAMPLLAAVMAVLGAFFLRRP